MKKVYYGVIPKWRKKGEIIPFKTFKTKKEAEKWLKKHTLMVSSFKIIKIV